MKYDNNKRYSVLEGEKNAYFKDRQDAENYAKYRSKNYKYGSVYDTKTGNRIAYFREGVKLIGLQYQLV